MAYMRGEHYIYSSGEYMEFVTPNLTGSLETARMEELAVMVFLRLVADGRATEVIERTYEYWGGNFGADGVAKFLGKPTTMDTVREMMKES